MVRPWLSAYDSLFLILFWSLGGIGSVIIVDLILMEKEGKGEDKILVTIHENNFPLTILGKGSKR